MKGKILGRTLSLALAATAMISLSACGKSDNSNSNSSSTDTTVTAEVKKVAGFNYFAMASGKETAEFNNSLTANLVKEHTGYDVKYEQAPADMTDAQTAVMNIFMARDDYQAVKVTKNQFYSLLAMDALKEITPYVNASTNLKTEISEFGWATATKNDKIYAIPQKDPRLASDIAIAFRVDWLKEYNAANTDKAIPLPSEENNYSMSITDYKTMLTYFKEKVPQGGTAMAVDINSVYQENILPAFGVYQEWVEVDGKLEYYVNQPGFSDYMAYMKELFDAGLITYQATSGDANTVKQLQAKTVGAGRIPHWNAVTIEKTETAATDDNIGYIQALVPDDARGDASKVRALAREGYAYYTVIPKYSTDEQAASVVDWADKKLEKDFFLKMILGTESETFEIKDGNKYYPILPIFDEKQNLSDKFTDGTREADYANYWLCRTRKTEAQDKMFSRGNYQIDKTGIKSPLNVMPPNEVYDSLFTAADTEVKTALVKTMFQKGSTTTLADIQKVYEVNKGTDIDATVNEWYATWDGKDTYNSVKPR